MSIYQQVPHEWGNCKLSQFIEMTHNNALATFEKNKNEYSILSQIDALLFRITEKLDHPKTHRVVPMLIIKSHSTYRAACSLIMSGQTYESFTLSRSVLESVGYCFHIYKNINLGNIWLERIDSKKSFDENFRFKKRKGSKNPSIESSINSINDSMLSSKYLELYEKSIDCGAHPNPNGILANSSRARTNTINHYNIQYIENTSNFFHLGLEHLIKVGICSLYIINHIFIDRLNLYGISDEIYKLKNYLK